jgi:hypothetical protein
MSRVYGALVCGSPSTSLPNRADELIVMRFARQKPGLSTKIKTSNKDALPPRTTVDRHEKHLGLMGRFEAEGI